ncbi:hypothetical protein Poli38472_014092 [Pythium oligandrum]|uniref:Uncharacterized protein n=1 Tax=Pythium oligandrum TaxID=41045 RepID=A0A8K1FK61_PYTOL|nr:hypothetical protein Poli38472_014092 [Pythium oligandrum]|eukprot:TMW66780.1 hypothetical protein Poli38472_014092 [Pythium oligandrum]
MTERVLLLLAQPSVLEALQQDDVLDTLNDISPLSEHYVAVLQFLLKPENLTALVFCLLEEPPPSTERHARVEPTYEEYAIVYRAHWVLCGSTFSSQLLSALLAFQPSPLPLAAFHTTLCERLVTFQSRDTMNLEALTRFLNVLMDQYSSEMLLAFLGPDYDMRFVANLLVLIHYEPIRDVLLRIFNEAPHSVARSAIHSLTTQLLDQLAPLSAVSPLQHDPNHVHFSRMLFTCDLLTDLIHENRQGSLGYLLIQQLNTVETHVKHILDAVLRDLEKLPTAMANESFAIKVLNSLLQLSQCGCVAKAAFAASFANAMAMNHNEPVDDAFCSPHVDLPVLWKQFIARLPTILAFLDVPKVRRYRTTHIQVIYLMLPILNVSCCVVDRLLIAHRTMETLLSFVLRFPQANILHCAISRLYIVALEDSPFMFGKELPAFRAANDSLRMHLLLQGCFESVVKAYENDESSQKPPLPPPALIDIAISFDQAVTSAQAHSPHLFRPADINRWQEFRERVLMPTQTLWEEAAPQVTPSVLTGAGGPGIIEPESELYNPSDSRTTGLQLSKLASNDSESAPTEATLAPEVPTPLAALYNEEEKHLMRHVAAT